MMSKRNAFGLAALLLCEGGVLAADNAGVGIISPVAGVLNLRTGDVDTTQLANMLAGDAPFKPGTRYVVMLDGPMDPARAAAMDGLGITRRGYLPLSSFIADLDKASPKQLRGLGFIRWVGEYQDAWRMDPLVAAGANGRAWQTAPRRALAAAGDVAVNIWLFGGLPEHDVVRAMTTIAGCRITAVSHVGGSSCVAATMHAADTARLGTLADVQYVEFQGEFTERSNAAVRSIVQSGVLNITPLYNRGLHGEGEIVGLIDTDLNKDHCSFSDTVPIGPAHRKILAYNTFFGSASHGTHVGGTLCGDAGTAGDTRGVAFAARMVYNFFPDQNEPSVFDHFDLHASQGARMHNNSWGDSSTRAYDGASRAIDSLSHDQEDNLIVFAVTDFNIPVTNPENAKNCLAVAASGGNNTMGQPSQEFYCAGGISPTLDGRRKPEIMAPGCNTASANNFSTCGTAVNSGTSMAAPAVTGTGALIRQYFQSGFYPSGLPSAPDGFIPTGQLVKAALINSAVNISGESGFPSAREGWGRVLADNAVYFEGDFRHLIVRDVRNTALDALATGSSVSLPVRVASGQPLKITLAWADQPGAVNATFTPVNDLDLVVTSPTGLVYRGNNFASGESAAGGNADAVNNLEQVLVSTPMDGVWTIDLVGTAVNVGPQGYALVVTGSVGEVVCLTDYNQDGNADQADIDALIQDIAAGTITFPPNDPDVNRDGNTDAGDIDYLLNAIAGGGCP